jgi:hypothetical protein
LTRAPKNDFSDLFYSIVVSLCWIKKRPVMISDLESFLDLSQKQIRRMLDKLERRCRIAKITQRKDDSLRPCVAWVIADRENLPASIRYVCQNCGVGSPSETYRDQQLCEACLVAVKHNERRVCLTPEDEEELSMYLTIISTSPNENTLG